MNRCPTPTKKRYLTRSAAVLDMAWIQAISTRDVVPRRAYECCCGYWHLTSMTAFQEARRHHASH